MTQEIELLIGVMAPFFMLSVLIISMYYLGGSMGNRAVIAFKTKDQNMVKTNRPPFTYTGTAVRMHVVGFFESRQRVRNTRR